MWQILLNPMYICTSNNNEYFRENNKAELLINCTKKQIQQRFLHAYTHQQVQLETKISTRIITITVSNIAHVQDLEHKFKN